ncbi:MAG: hypothetical protein SGARI_002139 [Bacillariaceae sp.]
MSTTFAKTAAKEAALRKALSSTILQTTTDASTLAKATKQNLKLQSLHLQFQLNVLQELERLKDDDTEKVLQQLFALLLDNNGGAGVSAAKLAEGLHKISAQSGGDDVELFSGSIVEATQRAKEVLGGGDGALTTLGEFQWYVETLCAALNTTVQELAELLLVSVVFHDNKNELGNSSLEKGGKDDDVARIIQQEENRRVQSRRVRKGTLLLVLLLSMAVIALILYFVIVTGTVRICKVSAEYSFTLEEYYSPGAPCNGTASCRGRTLDARCPEGGNIDF